MPILKILALPQKHHDHISSALKAATQTLADVWRCDQAHVSILWHEVTPGLYFQGGKESIEQPPHGHPPLCELWALEGKDPDTIQRALVAVAQTLGQELHIPENIFITYREAQKGQVVDGKAIY